MTSYSASKEVQQAIYAKIQPNGVLDSILSSLGILAVYNARAVPQNAPYPYMTIGEGYETSDDTLGTLGFKYSFTINIYSWEDGGENLEDAVSRINELFHEQDLTLQTLKHVYTLNQRSIIKVDPD